MAHTITDDITSIFFNNKANNVVGTVTLDCVISENTLLNSEITDYPIENGTYIQDHVFNSPLKFSISGIITDYKLTSVFDFAKNLFNKETHTEPPIEEAITQLFALRDSNHTFKVRSGIVSYGNMVFESLSFSREADSGRSINITADLKQINYAQKKFSEAKTDINNAKDKNDNSAQNRANQEAEEDAEDVAREKARALHRLFAQLNT